MSRIKFKLNGVEHSVGGEIDSDLSLVDYIRNHAELRGTKYNCREGGCGACVVSVIKSTGGTPMAVDACLVSVFSCENWDISTIERIGNRQIGYHALQTALAEAHGTQCGYCSPGFIMTMYSLLKSNPKITMLEIEKSLPSNICRCTGYRPILDAFKKFASDAPSNAKKILDIEELYVCNGNKKECNNKCGTEDWCFLSRDDFKSSNILEIELKDNRKWFKVDTVEDIIYIMKTYGTDSYMLVAGNTAKGVVPIDSYPRLLIDISEVSELKGYTMDQNLILGASNSLTEAIEIFQSKLSEEYFGYLQQFVDHILLVAHPAVRNIGTIGGNLMIRHSTSKIPSDIFLLLESVGAELTIIDTHSVKQTVDLRSFLSLNMTGKIILNVILPPLSKHHKYVTYKIMPRAQAGHAVVNAAFLYKVNGANTVQSARITYGGLSPNFIRATLTEQYLVGKQLFINDTLQAALTKLDSEMVVTNEIETESIEMRKKLAINLFYKGLLALCPTGTLKDIYKSGANKIHDQRPVSSGKQIYETDQSLWPLNQPITKLEALIQCAGEAPYTDDLSTYPREVFASFVLSTVATGKIVSIDAKRALKVSGVVACYTANDIPGINSFTPAGLPFFIANEEVLCSGDVRYYHQPIAIVVAETHTIAERAAKMVDVKYCNVKTPVLDIKIAKTDTSRLTLTKQIDATEKGTDVSKIIEDSNTIYGQHHFTMETLACISKPTEEGIEIHASSQWMNGVHLMLSRALQLKENKIDVHIRRIGGGFGMKISRTIQIAVATGLVTQKLNRPCRFIPLLTDNMKVMGKRGPCTNDFKIGVNKSGVIQYIDHNIYGDNGYILNEQLYLFGIDVYNNCYNPARWNYKWYDCTSDNAKTTWCRSPGTLENIAMAEFVMERISYELALDPLAVRYANLSDTYKTDIEEVVTTLKSYASYDERRATVDKFNTENRWKKRGMRFSLLRWTPLGTTHLNIVMSVYHGDGTVSITHGGIEMGQGINTKAAQIAAHFLNISVDKIQIKANNTMITPNNIVSGGSFTSQYVGIGVERCCKKLLEKLEPTRIKLGEPTWEELIQEAFTSNIDLQTQAYVGTSDVYISDIFGATLAEVEVDILTGEHEIIRVDLIEDVGQSVSPDIDVGQIEGAFVMGLGYWTCEKLIYDTTGELVTNRAWNYKVPQARDIPQDFRVYFRNNSYSSAAVLGSKMTGEPATCMSVVIPLAIREALSEARKDAGIPTTNWFAIDGAYHLDKILMATSTRTSELKFY